jgi:hypothetical protein
MSSIYDEDLKSCLGEHRDPYVIDPRFPSLPMMRHFRIRFSGKHEDEDWYRMKITRLQHYELLFDVVLKKIPCLITLLV